MKEKFNFKIEKNFRNYTIKINPKDKEDYYLFVVDRTFSNRLKELSDKLNKIEDKELDWVLLGEEIVGIKFENYFFRLEDKGLIVSYLNKTTFCLSIVASLPIIFLIVKMPEEYYFWSKFIPISICLSVFSYFYNLDSKINQELEKKCILEVQNSSDN